MGEKTIQSFKSKFFAAFITIVMAFNCSAMSCNLFRMDFNTVSAAIESQSAVISYFSFSVLPMQILNKVLLKESPLASPVKKDSRTKDSKNSSSYKDLIMSDGKNIKKLEEIGVNIKPLYLSMVNFLQSVVPLSVNYTLISGAGFIVLIFLFAMFLLPRGSIDDYIKSIIMINKNPTREYLWLGFLF